MRLNDKRTKQEKKHAKQSSVLHNCTFIMVHIFFLQLIFIYKIDFVYYLFDRVKCENENWNFNLTKIQRNGICGVF